MGVSKMNFLLYERKAFLLILVGCIFSPPLRWIAVFHVTGTTNNDLMNTKRKISALRRYCKLLFQYFPECIDKKSLP